MKDGIKEILEYLKNDFYAYGETYIGEKCKIVTKKENYQLLDYVTNLQEENEELKEQNTKLYKKDTKIINELKEELEITHEKWNKDKQWSECRTKEWLDYKQRIDKAIEYIKNNKYKKMGGYGDNEDEDIEICLFEDDINNLLNILTGGDEE